MAKKNNVKENVKVVSKNEVYLLDDEGQELKRICGHIKKDGLRCKAPAGWKTDHSGYGLCYHHDRGRNASKSWRQLSQDIAEGSSLGKILERSQDGEVVINDVTKEINFQQALLLWYIDHVMNRTDYDEDGNEMEPEFTPKDIKILKNLNQDMIKAKESAAKIKGSLKLDAVVVRKFVDSILTFLVSELESKLRKNEVMQLMEKLMEKVLVPMSSKGMINGDVSALSEVPEGMKSMKMIAEDDTRKKVDNVERGGNSDG